MKVSGHLVDIHDREIYPAILHIRKGKISGIEKTKKAKNIYIMPGLIDAHIHIESSMITPGAFAMAAVKHGTAGVVSDPHEIANVLGIKGVKFMINDAEKVPMRFWFGAPSCVPATEFETNGEIINHIKIKKLLKLKKIKYMSEMMNFPGVINKNTEVWNKLKIAKSMKKPVDGHAPGLTGEMLGEYVAAGISTDHECSKLSEAKEKISLGMKILIREGSAARNLNSLKGLFNTDPEMIMLCSDDLHPEMLNKRHINKIIGQLISEGFDMFDVIRSATINPAKHYGLEAGMLQEGQSADFILVDNLRKMNVIETWIKGKKVFANGNVLFYYKPGIAINNFNCTPVKKNEFKVVNTHNKLRIIEAFDGELLTKEIIRQPASMASVESDTENDILKIIVKDRYLDSHPAVGFIKGFGLKDGAFASSIAHDSHNIISVGTNDIDIMSCINEIIKLKGGLAVSSNGRIKSLQLNIGGIMTTHPCSEVAHDYENLII